MKIKHNNKGFTLVELVVSMAVFAIATVAISSILVAAIRYSGLSFREEANLREVMTIERVLEASLKDAKKIEALVPNKTAEEDTWEWKNLSEINPPENNGTVNFSYGGMFLLRFQQSYESGKVYELLALKKDSGETTKLWYRIGTEALTEVPDDVENVTAEDINALGMTILSENIKDLEIIYTDKTLDYQMTVKNQATEHNLHRFWNIGVEKTAAGAI